MKFLEKSNENTNCQPSFYRIKNLSDEKALFNLIQTNPSIEIIDELNGQLEELIKLKNPQKKLTPEELKTEIKHHLNLVPMKKYGVWVYYSWINKIVHILDEEEFIEVRTNRNRNKITREEQAILKTKKIGIIGLSVGNSIATNIAMERACGELILADFDCIELSNLNRIKTGVQNFGVKKTIVAAREIAEIDPFFKVRCLHEGLTENNITNFFMKDGKLDICIEVCDGLFAKIFAREKAKELKIPVVMNSSDRGTTDIERFDLNPDLPLLHGMIDHLDLNALKKAKTNEEKVPFLLAMLGPKTSSKRLMDSMLEIKKSITTWPQLASGVTFGGGICTDVCRRILLNEFTASGRYFVDIEEQISNH
jgi:hypothetical protein